MLTYKYLAPQSNCLNPDQLLHEMISGSKHWDNFEIVKYFVNLGYSSFEVENAINSYLADNQILP